MTNELYIVIEDLIKAFDFFSISKTADSRFCKDVIVFILKELSNSENTEQMYQKVFRQNYKYHDMQRKGDNLLSELAELSANHNDNFVTDAYRLLFYTNYGSELLTLIYQYCKVSGKGPQKFAVYEYIVGQSFNNPLNDFH